MGLSLVTIISAAILLTGTTGYSVVDYDSGEGSDEDLPSCDTTSCKAPTCSCLSTSPPGGLSTNVVPQFVMLTFDDAINIANANTYFKILAGRKNKGNGCPIAMTFFVCHEYNDYNITNTLYRMGNEIAVHSITHETNTDNWKAAKIQRWTDEMVGMRKILSKFGGIPEKAITGHRAPFLQTAGNETFRMLQQHFVYDSSMPTRQYMDPPIWPYTLNHGYQQDCQIRPCPRGAYNGLWLVPMVQYRRISRNPVDNKLIKFYCSMADACTPYPETADDTKNFLIENFKRHYTKSKAPFPLFLHESWLRNEFRLEGYLQFLDEILNHEDVFVVTVKDVIDYMKSPISLDEYKKKGCTQWPSAGDCSNSRNCYFQVRNRFMHSCVSCPRRYPWVGNPEGVKTL